MNMQTTYQDSRQLDLQSWHVEGFFWGDKASEEDNDQLTTDDQDWKITSDTPSKPVVPESEEVREQTRKDLERHSGLAYQHAEASEFFAGSNLYYTVQYNYKTHIKHSGIQRLLARHLAKSNRYQTDTINIGATKYRLRNKINFHFSPMVSNGTGELTLAQEGNDFRYILFSGFGSTLKEALDDWAQKLHVLIQKSLIKRSWERTPEENEIAKELDHFIDLQCYFNETPLRSRRLATVAQIRLDLRRIEICWEDNSKEWIRYSQAPPDFAAYDQGQRFEALVLQKPSTYEMIKMLDVTPLGPAQTPAPERWERVQAGSKHNEIGLEAIK